MHILMVTNYFEPDSGAAAVRLTRLAKGLQAHGHQLTILTSLPHYPQGQIHEGYRNRLFVTENRDGMRVIQTWLLATPSPRISRKLVSQISFMLTACFRGLGIPRPDVVLVEAQPIFAGLAGVCLAALKRTPYVLNVSDLWPDHLISVGALTESSLAYRAARRIANMTYAHASRIITLSPRWKEIIQDYIGDENKIQTIYNGVDLALFRPNMDTSTFCQNHGFGGEKIISFIGTFSTQYDFETMMAFAKHFNHHNDVQVVFIGQGSQSETLKKYLQQPEFSKLKWIHWIEHEEVPQAWNASYLTYWAIHDEPLYQGTIPAKMYEAMACGTPIVGAIEGVAAQIIEESNIGVAVPCNDTQSLIEAAEKLIHDEDRRQEHSQSARRYAEEHYDPAKVVARYEEVLSDAAGC